MSLPRILHVIDTCGAGGIETTFLNVLRVWQADAPWGEHRLLALGSGVLEPAFREVTSETTVTSEADALAAVLTRPHDVVHFLFERVACRWVPFVVGHSAAAVVYGKGYDMAGAFRAGDGFRWQPDESVMWGCDRVTFTTEPLAHTYGAPAGRSTVLGKAADIGAFLNIPEIEPDTPLRIVCVANLHRLKRLSDLIRAAARLQIDYPRLRVRFVGADPAGEQPRLAGLARELGVEHACEWVGRRADVTEDLAASCAFALPSGREGVPTAMLEAMPAARPVVMPDVGHVRSVVRDGVEGYLVPVGDLEALIDRIGRLLADRPLAAAMGRAARSRAAAHDVRAIAGRLRQVIESADSGDRTRGAAA